MGKGRFVNQKLGKQVHRGIDQKLWKTKTKGPPAKTDQRLKLPGGLIGIANEDRAAGSATPEIHNGHDHKSGS